MPNLAKLNYDWPNIWQKLGKTFVVESDFAGNYDL